MTRNCGIVDHITLTTRNIEDHCMDAGNDCNIANNYPARNVHVTARVLKPPSHQDAFALLAPAKKATVHQQN